jgi:hypothetical protein
MDKIISFIRSSKRKREREPESEGENEESESESENKEPESEGNVFTALTEQIQMVRCMHTHLCVMDGLGLARKKVTLKELYYMTCAPQD